MVYFDLILVSPTGKYVPPQKRKIQPVAKIVRHTPPPATNSMPPSINTQQSPQAPMKSYQPMPPQQQPMPYGSQQHMPYVPPHLQQQQHHQQHSTHPGHVKLNGDGMIGNKNMPPRNIRYNTAPPPVSFNEPPPSLTPVQLQQAHGMGKPTMHVAHPHGMVTAHMVVTQGKFWSSIARSSSSISPPFRWSTSDTRWPTSARNSASSRGVSFANATSSASKTAAH